MLRKYPKFVLFLVLFCLAGAGVFYFSNTWEGDETRTQTAPNLKILTSHSHPQAGDEWAVSFETIGAAGLTITPIDQDSIGDLDFVSLTCEGKEKTEEEPLQILVGGVIFYPDWQCDGTGEVIHLVNIARKHTLKFQFSNKMAFAYNNPDSVTDTFDNEDYIASSENITVSGGQVKLSICGDNGGGCSADGDCCSNNCDNSVCCAFGETCCSSDGHCDPDECLSDSQERDHYCDITTDHYCKYTDSNCSNSGVGSCACGSQAGRSGLCPDNAPASWGTSQLNGSWDRNCDTTVEKQYCEGSITCSTSGTEYDCYTSSGGGFCFNFTRNAYSNCSDGSSIDHNCGNDWTWEYCKSYSCLDTSCVSQGSKKYCAIVSRTCECR